MKFLVLVSALAFSASAFAAVSAFYDSKEKIDTILNDQVVARVLGQKAVTRIEGEGLVYVVLTQTCGIGVTLKAIPPSMPGKTTYVVQNVSMMKCD